MFSGIRYILGYADQPGEPPSSGSDGSQREGQLEEVTSSQVARATGPTSSSTASSSSSLTSYPSSSPSCSATSGLEQTLSAAASRFTEQLLPPQASIEQLQSSSHQLLPSIKEQHEENESRAQQQAAGLEEATEATEFPAQDNDDEDDDSFEADSWELLDLVEKVDEAGDGGVQGGRSSASVQEAAEASLPCKSTSGGAGILKSANAPSASPPSSSSSSSTNDNSCQQLRQKPKVSFETPDLVRSKQEIETQTIPKETAPPSSKKCRSNKNKRNSKPNRENEHKRMDEGRQAPAASSYATASNEAGAKEVLEGKLSANRNKGARKELDGVDSLLVVGTKTTTETASSEQSVVKPAVKLNYAKALSAKPKKDEVTNAKKMDLASEAAEPAIANKTMTNEDDNGAASGRPMKRNRPASNSSWSSGDEMETVENELEFWVKPSVSQSGAADAHMDDDDNISLSSSGFSDYCYGEISDYIVRPKKANSKRNRTQSGSFRAPKVGHGHPAKRAGPANHAETGLSEKSDESKGGSSKVAVKVNSGKSSKPKKKLILGSSSKMTVSSMDFLKPQAASRKQGSQTATFLEPNLPSNKQQSPVSSSNDSSEIPDMDESWYVTPPPCFTGAYKQKTADKLQQQPKAKEAARENALIEHPSIYIASSSKASANENATLADTGKPLNLSENIHPKKAEKKSAISKLEDAAWRSDDDEAFDDDQFICSKPIPKPVTIKHGPAPVEPVVASKAESGPRVNTTEKKASRGKQVASDDKRKAKLQVVSVKPVEKTAWKNKFIVDDWDLDEQDADSDFDSMFEPVKKKKKSRAKRPQQQQKSKTVVKDDGFSFDMSTDSEGPSHDILEISGAATRQDASNSVELISIRSLSMENSLDAENAINSLVRKEEEEVVAENMPEKRRQPTQVRPIEPERRPGWQLKKQRSKRRPLANSSADNKQAGKHPKSTASVKSSSPAKKGGAGGAGGSINKSAPTFMDRIGSSIVANLTNLTNGLVSSGALNSCGAPVMGHSSPLVENSDKMQQTVAARPSSLHPAISPSVRKQLSRGSLKRQNITAQQANMQRRPDRRLKMFVNPNGCSVNRKVHTSIH